jgi:acetoin utilization deacetylase AcuC-like enzyme
VPLPKDIRDEDMLCLYSELLGPVVQSYRPELILVAAGFDAHHMDPLGRARLTEKAYGGLTRLILDLRSAQGSPPLLLALEGGYSVLALARSVKEVLDVLTSMAVPYDTVVPKSEMGLKLVDKARSVHRQFGLWTD